MKIQVVDDSNEVCYERAITYDEIADPQELMVELLTEMALIDEQLDGMDA